MVDRRVIGARRATESTRMQGSEAPFPKMRAAGASQNSLSLSIYLSIRLSIYLPLSLPKLLPSVHSIPRITPARFVPSTPSSAKIALETRYLPRLASRPSQGRSAPTNFNHGISRVEFRTAMRPLRNGSFFRISRGRWISSFHEQSYRPTSTEETKKGSR